LTRGEPHSFPTRRPSDLSTGKNGKGVIPIDAEPLGTADVYGSDRLFIHVRHPGSADPAQDASLDALERAGHPVVRIGIAAPELLDRKSTRLNSSHQIISY